MILRTKTMMLVFFLVFFALMSGCEFNKPNSKNVETFKSTNNDVIEIHGSLENIERLDAFVKNTQSNKKDQIRLIRYTIEGDPILHGLDYDGTNLTFTLDTTRDKFGKGGVEAFSCKSIEKKETNTETAYLLNGCSDSSIKELLTISHNVEREDYFAFRLKYGTGKTNEIDTKNHKLVKALQNGTFVLNDFQLSKEDMNNVYKLMILSNFLEEKKLSKKCNQKPSGSYELDVWINSALRHFKWSECDNSKDGKEMTKLAIGIIDIVKHNPVYKTLPEENSEYK
ncbi:MAG: DUF4362 domain-containing protein [Bacillota bacterium]|nr:DUF4362 domain-containing protein [Bacillota bacterium]